MSSQETAMLEAHGKPYPSTVAGVGGLPTPGVDVPILSVFIALYVASAAGNMTTFQLNRRRGHKFLPNALLFGFSMSRILTCALRIGWAYHPHNVSLVLAANIFLTAGILLVYIVNLLFAQRILRARQPKLGWSLPLQILFRVFYALVIIFLVLIITFIVYQAYTLNPHWHTVTRNIQLGASTYFIILTAAPLLLVAASYILPPSPEPQTFGQGSMQMKALVVCVASTLCLLGAGFKAGVTWETPRPASDPAWYQSKACLYIFYFGLEVLILTWYLAMRVDQRFHVPDGASKRKTYVVKDVDGSISGSVDREMETETEKGSAV